METAQPAAAGGLFGGATGAGSESQLQATGGIDPEDDMVWLTVTDTGHGIEADDLPRIFEPFFSTKPVGKGTGLGLSVSYFIITENHSGEMDVFSETVKGTRFVIRLPKSRTG